MKAFTIGQGGIEPGIHVSLRGDGRCVNVGKYFVWLKKCTDGLVYGRGLESHIEHAVIEKRDHVPVLEWPLQDSPQGVIVLVTPRVDFQCDPRGVECVMKSEGWALCVAPLGESIFIDGVRYEIIKDDLVEVGDMNF